MNNFKEINYFVESRNSDEARRAIPRFLRRRGARPEDIFVACEWYRRLAVYREGFRLVAPELLPQGLQSTRAFSGQRLLWAARFLNLMGSPELALPLLEKLQLHGADDHWIAGNIFLVNFEGEKALYHFEQMRGKMSDSDSYPSRLRLLGLADAHAACNQLDRALELAEGVYVGSREPLLQGIALSASGEFFCRAGEFSRAKEKLLKAQSLLPARENTTDTAFLLKWLGFAEGRLGETNKAQAALNQAERRMRGLRMRPEAWLDCYRLREDLGLLSSEEQLRLRHYPGLSQGFLRLLTPHTPLEREEATAPLHLLVAAEEFEHDGRRYLGIPLELRLLAWIRITESWGFDTLKAKSLLWSDEIHSYLQLDSRLNQLLHRIRYKYGIPVRLEGGVLRIHARSLRRVSVSTISTLPSFLQTRSSFAAEDLSSYYVLGKTQRTAILRIWKKNDWIRPKGKGPSTRYLRRCEKFGQGSS